MDRVGGYTAYLALCEDARAYDDIMLAMHGEADAARVLELERKSKGGRA